MVSLAKRERQISWFFGVNMLANMFLTRGKTTEDKQLKIYIKCFVDYDTSHALHQRWAE